jgi:hypothetical protein
MDILGMLTEQLGGDALGQISRQLGTDEKTAGNATAAGVSALIGALSRNAGKADGAAALDNALAKDHDGSVLDNLTGFLGNPDTGTGQGILGHVLGGQQRQVESGLSQATGLDSAGAGKLLAMLAPVVMGALGKAKQQGNLDASGLSNLLGEQKAEISKRDPQAMGLLDRLLDSDGDGDFDMGDAAKHGMGLLGKLFKK